MLAVIGAAGQFEREMMLERQREGIAQAKKDGKYKGRTPTARRKAGDILRLKDEGIEVRAQLPEMSMGQRGYAGTIWWLQRGPGEGARNACDEALLT